MTRPIKAIVHSKAITHNYNQVKQTAPASRAFAVVKANAYGHGLERAARALAHADGFGILEIEGALALRRWGMQQPVLLLEGVFSQSELIEAARQNFSVAVHEPGHLAWLEQVTLPQPLNIFLKLNTGMNRLGFPAEQARDLAAKLGSLSNVASVTLMAHFATADEPAKGIEKQFTRFQHATEGLKLPISLANSAATFAYPQTRTDWVRPGIVLYGASPFDDRSAKELGLQAAMTLQSQLIAVQHLQAGDTVGYGATFTADRPMRIGVVACGYADGYPRHAPAGTPVNVAGQRTRVIGRVSMDMLTIDITDLPQAQIGSPVELWGSEVPIDEVARAAGTIGYELMCAVAPRVPVHEG
ncbi:alanine racemase [Silvimonas terrae]|uniref:Alanine racemase n=1 Tax=Silvimonas terrae TaxID=300266 RepID=A0A840R9N7_9NEIS|nr:alanine racemase [Silvimonas terrae]MBB5189314.1 alanine racemase [Silvimonas terrae]